MSERRSQKHTRWSGTVSDFSAQGLVRDDDKLKSGEGGERKGLGRNDWLQNPCNIHLDVREGVCRGHRNHAGNESQPVRRAKVTTGDSSTYGAQSCGLPLEGSVLLTSSPWSAGLGALPGSQKKLEIWSFGRDLSNTGGGPNKTHLWADMACSPPICKLRPAPMRTLKFRNISLVRGKAGTHMGLRSPNAFEVAGWIDLPAFP